MEFSRALALFAVFGAILAVITPILGSYMARVFSGERTLAHHLVGPVETLLYRVTGIDPDSEMGWKAYTLCMLAFNGTGILVLYTLLRLQGLLPLNPTGAPSMSGHLAFNTAVSFVTNTNWQAYAGERAASHLSQMVGLTWQNFASAATGMAVAVAFVRGLTRRQTKSIGNFWVDLTRSWLYVLLPLSLAISIVMVAQGVPQTLAGRVQAENVEGGHQTLTLGPVASQEAIKELGTNGGGFFNANSAHPYENPTPLTDFLQVLAVLSIPAGFTYLFGRFAGNQRQGWVVFSAMALLFVMALGVVYSSERVSTPSLSGQAAQGGNMEGKETRFGIAHSSLFAVTTTAASSGCVDCSHSSLTPLGGGMVMLNIALGEVVFGGVGSGLYGMLIFALLAVFIAGLMVGRTPEYLGKKIGPREMKMSVLAVLALEMGILAGSAVAVSVPVARDAVLNAGPHALTEILYGFHSAVGNNGSAFAGLDASGPFYCIALGLGMLVGRYFFMIPVLAIAGSMATKTAAPSSSGTFPTDGGLFVVLLVGVVLIVGALTFFPAYALGPVLEQLAMRTGALF